MSFLTKLPKDRYSPRAFDEFSNKSTFDLGNAKALAWLSQLAYETDEPDKIAQILRLWGLELVDGGVVVEEVATVLPKASTACFVATGRGAVIVAFAGTDPLVLANWITDFDVHIEATGAARGYDTAADAVWPRLKSLIGKVPAANVLVTGHSLGGALAVLTAHRILTDAKREVQSVY